MLVTLFEVELKQVVYVIWCLYLSVIEVDVQSYLVYRLLTTLV